MRISFFGGGTDYPEYFETESGAVLGMAIDKSTFVSATPIYSRLFDYSVKVAYRKIECVTKIDDIEHGPYRECLRHCGVTGDVEVNYLSEVPAFAGLGSSSTFVVGVLEYVIRASRSARARAGASVPGHRDRARGSPRGSGLPGPDFRGAGRDEPVGVPQDHAHRRASCSAEPNTAGGIPGTPARFLHGNSAPPHNIAAKQIENIDKNLERLKRMRRMVDEGHTVLTAKGTLERFGRLLDESWRLKRELADGITNDTIGGIYKDAIEAGAWGGKLLGAGVGGFILFFVPPEKKGEVRSRLARLQEIEVHMNAVGSQIIHADQQGMFSPVPLYDNAGQSGPRKPSQ